MTGALEPVRLHAAPAAASLAGEDLGAIAAARAAERVEAAYRRGAADRVASGAAALEAALAELDAAAERAQEELAMNAVELGVEIARTLLGTRLDAGDYDLERIVRCALADAEVGRGACVVHLHPEDHARLEGVLFRSGTTLAIDPDIARGDVHLSTPRGLLVRELDEALTTIREQLLEELVE